MSAPHPVVTQGALQLPDGSLIAPTKTDVSARVSGPVAEVRVAQAFSNPSTIAVDATYVFPLPSGASVARLELRVRGRTIRAVIKEKEAARTAFAQARAEGRAASLLEEDRPTLFSLQVANIPAGDQVDVSLVYHELLAFDDGEWRFVFPMTAPERYRELAAGEAVSTVAREVRAIRPPRRPIRELAGGLSVRLDLPGASVGDHGVRCLSHANAEIVASANGVAVVLAGDRVANRDLVVVFRAAGDGVRPRVWFSRQRETSAAGGASPGAAGTMLLALTPPGPRRPVADLPGLQALRCGNCGASVTDLSAIREIPGLGPVMSCGYCGALLAPGTAVVTKAVLPRDVLVLVDRSASVRDGVAVARQAVRAVLAALAPGDAVQVVAFDHVREPIDGEGRAFLALSPELVARVDRFLSERPPRGGSEVDRALELAASLPARDGRTALVVLITDGAVGNEGRLLRRIPELLGRRRLFVLGVGPEVDRRLVRRMAEVGGGAADVLASADDGDTIARFSRRVREGGPVLCGVAIHFEGPEPSSVCPATLGDLYGGEPIQLLARFDGSGPGKAIITAVTADGRPYRQELAYVLPTSADDAPGLDRLWAKAKMDLHMEQLAREPGAASQVREAVLALALAHALPSAYTSLLAEEEGKAASGGESSAAVPAPAEVRFDSEAAGEVGAAPFELCSVGADADDLAPPGVGGSGVAAPISGPPAAFFAVPAARAAAPLPSPPRPHPTRTRGGPASVSEEAFRGIASPSGVAAPAGGLAGAIGAVTSLLERVIGSGTSTPDAAPPSTPLEGVGSEPYAAEELAWLADRPVGALDLVFLVDETGSMGPYIEEVKRRLQELVAALRASPLCRSLRLGLVTYRDHPPQDSTYPSKVSPLTDDIDTIAAAVGAMQASGGGDGPESVTDGLFDVVRLAWRPGAARAVVWFGDAPPHGVGAPGDAFPQGCPCGNHWFTQAETAREMGVAIYAVGCALYEGTPARSMFGLVAETSRGLYLPLADARLLVPLIAGAALSELDRTRIDEHVLALIRAWRDDLVVTDRDEQVRWVTERLREEGVRPREMAVPDGVSVPPSRFRTLEPSDVSRSLDRLVRAGRVSV